MSPTARTLKFLRSCGHQAEVVERWIPRANVRRDLFHCIDVVAVRRGEMGVLGVQVTTLPNLSSRLAKARAQPELRTWLAAGNRFSLHGWYQRGGQWDVKIVDVQAGNLAAVVVQTPARRRGGKGFRQPDLFVADLQTAQDSGGGPITTENDPQAGRSAGRDL